MIIFFARTHGDDDDHRHMLTATAFGKMTFEEQEKCRIHDGIYFGSVEKRDANSDSSEEFGDAVGYGVTPASETEVV